MNRVQELRAQEFIKKLKIESWRYSRKEVASSYEFYADLPNGKTRKFGSVRYNIRGQDPGKLIVYAVKGFSDPEERFECQKQNHKHCSYKFWPDDEEAMKYAVRAVESAYGNKVR